MKEKTGKFNKLKQFCTSLLTLLVVFSMTFVILPPAEADSEEPDVAVPLEEGTYAPGEVIVMFRGGAVEETGTSIKSALSLENIGDDYGASLEATGEAAEAAKTARSQVDILRASLGDDFVIEDTIVVDEELTIALVSSGSYDTAEMIELLSANEDVASVEPNSYREPQSYDYSLNDPLNKNVYHTNSPAATNSAGDNVSSRGAEPSEALSVNAGAAWAKATGNEDEVVVAVMDSGVNYNHEDLKDALWTNPGNIGLAGKHGYNFDDNAADVMDTVGHGTHVSGILNATANNGKGIAGVASGMNVKIMMLSTASAVGKSELTAYKELGAFNYIIKAKERGVNIVATSNSWGTPNDSAAYDEIINRLGEVGVVTFIAASNDHSDIDKHAVVPAGSDSEFKITVGSSDIYGNPSSFSNFGQTKVDIFAPGSNIYSSVIESVYFPAAYPAEERAANTEFFGQFSADTAIAADGTVTPETGDGSLSPFGASVFVEQDKPDDYEEPDPDADPATDPESGSTEDPDTDPETDPGSTEDPASGSSESPAAVCKLNIATDKYLTGNGEKPASLEVTIENASPDKEYYLYFPYAKNPETTGIDNTKFSLTTICGYDETCMDSELLGGEVNADSDGCRMTYTDGQPHQMNANEAGEAYHIREDKYTKGRHILLSAAEAEGKTTGIGVRVTPNSQAGESGKVHFYIDSVAVSKPGADIPDENSSYDIMSGTSMATPAAAGAYAVVAALNPRAEGQNGAEYARETRDLYLSCVRKTDQLEKLCNTGGYIDLSLLAEGKHHPVISDAVCDTAKKTLTLKGTGLKGTTLSYKSLVNSDAEAIALPSGKMTLKYADDGKSVVISNATPLFGTYTQFLVSSPDGTDAQAGFFLVKGQKQIERVFMEEHPEKPGSGDSIEPHFILTDKDGKNVYGYEPATGMLSKYDGKGFSIYSNTNLNNVIHAAFQKLGYNKYELNELSCSLLDTQNAVYDDNMIYQFAEASYTPPADDSESAQEGDTQEGDTQEEEPQEEIRYYIASMNFASASPEWTLTEYEGFEEVFADEGGCSNPAMAAMNGKIYCIGDLKDEGKSAMYSYDTKAGTWAKEPEMPAAISKAYVFPNNGKLYVLSGTGEDEKLSRRVYCFDGKSWTRMKDIPFIGRFGGENDGSAGRMDAGIAPVKKDFIFVNCSAEGAGNIFLYNTDNGVCEPLYMTHGSSISVNRSGMSAVETRDGIYYMECGDDSALHRYEMYLIPKSSGAYVSKFIDPAISKKSVKLASGKTSTLKVTGGKVSSWASSNKKVATVKNGKVTALSKGNAVITAKLSTGAKLTCKVTVTSSPKLSKKIITVKKGKTKTITIKGKASSVKNVYKKTKVAKVTSKATATKIKVKGLKKGKTTLKIKVNGVTLKLKVKVK